MLEVLLNIFPLWLFLSPKEAHEQEKRGHEEVSYPFPLFLFHLKNYFPHTAFPKGGGSNEKLLGYFQVKRHNEYT